VQLGVGGSGEETSYRSKLGNLKVLLLDSDGENDSARGLMKRWGLEVIVVPSLEAAGQAVEAARKIAKPFDLVLLQAEPSRAEAFAFIRNFKMSHEAFVLMTTAVHDGDAAECRKLGVDALLVKPLNPTELWNAVLKILQSGPRGNQANFGGLRILVAEDNPINQTLATVMLETRGHKVTIAENGLEVLAKLEEGESFDLILMDLQMPLLDGLVTTERIRAQEKEGSGSRIPIVALTAHGDPGACLAAGMDGFLKRPLDEDKLMEIIAKLIDLNELSPEPRPAESPAPSTSVDSSPAPQPAVEPGQAPVQIASNPAPVPPTSAPAPAKGSSAPVQAASNPAQVPVANSPAPLANQGPAARSSSPGQPALASSDATAPAASGHSPFAASNSDAPTAAILVVDEAALLGRMGNNRLNLCRLIDVFMKLYPEQLQEVRQAIDQGQSESLHRTAHTIKGSLMGFSANHAAEAAEALEKLGQGGTIEGAELAYNRLVAEVEKVAAALEGMRVSSTTPESPALKSWRQRNLS
jgi:CheY-like chemotaxis protein/HPt (histidine-containing phosphotransfer) domain-containing protein